MNLKRMFCSAALTACICMMAAEPEFEPINFEKGVRGTAIVLNGMNTYLTDTTPCFAIEKGLTVSLWVKPVKWGHLAGLVDNVGSFQMLKRDMDCGGVYFWDTKGHKTSSLIWAPKAFPLPLNQWHHIAFTYDQKGHAVGYLDGVKVAEQRPGQEAVGQGIVEIDTGKHYSKGNFRLGLSYRGSMDEVYIYGRTLSESEIVSLNKGEAPEGALAAYLMDDPENPGNDSSGHSRHLKPACGPTGKPAPILGSVIDAPAAAANQALTAWCRSSLDRVFQHDKLQSVKIVNEPITEMAGNEWESFQLVLTPNRDLNDVTLMVSDFKLGKVSFPVQVRMVDYVKIHTPSNIRVQKGGQNVYGETVSVYPGADAEPGWYPDPLRTIRDKFTLKANESKAFWISIKTPVNVPAGIYCSTAKVKAGDESTLLDIPLSVKVRAFSLPDELSSRHTTATRAICSTSDVEAFRKVLSDYYLSPDESNAQISVAFNADGSVKLDTAAWDREMEMAVGKYHQSVIFLPTIAMYGIPKAESTNASWQGIPMIEAGGKLRPEFEEKFAKFLEAISAHLKEKGWLDRTVIRLTDEPWTPDDFKLCHAISKLVKKHAPGIKTHISKWPTKESIGCADIWCVGAVQPSQINKGLARGEIFEQYPNWHLLIDRPVMDRRMLGFQMWKYHLSGILHYSLEQGWQDPDSLISPQLRYEDGRVIFGSGLIMYPDLKGVPTPSIRIDTIRDALEDYEYLCILEKRIAAHPNDPVSIEAAAYMQDAADKLVPCYESEGDGLYTKWKTLQWELDWKVLLNYRKGIMERIEKLN